MSSDLREEIVWAAHAIYARGLSHGSTGNISARTDDGFLVTPTGSNLGRLTPDGLSLLDEQGRHLDGPKASKEAFLHLAMYRARPTARAVVHTHSAAAAAVSTLASPAGQSAIPPLTAYFSMRVGCLPLLPYAAPGDERIGDVAQRAAESHPALLLRNHGPIGGGASVMAALDVIEEIEATARVFLDVRHLPHEGLTAAQIADLNPTPCSCSTKGTHE